MAILFRTLQRCERCEHEQDHACLILREEIRKAVALVNERAARHGYTLPPAEVTLSCPGFWRKGRSHG